MHDPVQALLQQTPSTHAAPSRQPSEVALVQGWPCLLLHLPPASHVPEQRRVGSAVALAAVQTWSAPQTWQLPGQSPSTQQAPTAMQAPLQDFMFEAQA
jgi:hypothetical protein